MRRSILLRSIRASSVSCVLMALGISAIAQESYVLKFRVNSLAVAGEGAENPKGLKYAVSPGSVRFAYVYVGRPEKTYFLLENTGDVGFGISSISFSDAAWSAEYWFCNDVFEGGDSCFINVQFTPREIRNYDAEMTVTLTGGQTFTLPLQGEGRNPLVPSSDSDYELPLAFQGKSYSMEFGLERAWNLSPYAIWAPAFKVKLAAGSVLPQGLYLDEQTGRIAGIPTLATDSATFTLVGEYSGYSPSIPAERTFKMRIAP